MPRRACRAQADVRSPNPRRRVMARIQDERNRHEADYQKINEALRQEKETVEGLRQQIEQLKIIEQMLNERKLKKTPAT